MDKRTLLYPPPALYINTYKNLQKSSAGDIIKLQKWQKRPPKVPTWHPLLPANFNVTTPFQYVPLPAQNTSIILHNFAGNKFTGLMRHGILLCVLVPGLKLKESTTNKQQQQYLQDSRHQSQEKAGAQQMNYTQRQSPNPQAGQWNDNSREKQIRNKTNTKQLPCAWTCTPSGT